MLKFTSSNGEPTVLTTEIETTSTQDQRLLRRTDRKLKIWVRSVSNERRCILHFGRIVTSDVHSRLVAARRVQGVGGSVTFTRRPPPAKICEWPR